MWHPIHEVCCHTLYLYHDYTLFYGAPYIVDYRRDVPVICVEILVTPYVSRLLGMGMDRSTQVSTCMLLSPILVTLEIVD